MEKAPPLNKFINFTLYNYQKNYAYLISFDAVDEETSVYILDYLKETEIVCSFDKNYIQKAFLDNLQGVIGDIGNLIIQVSVFNVLDNNQGLTPESVYVFPVNDIKEETVIENKVKVNKVIFKNTSSI